MMRVPFIFLLLALPLTAAPNLCVEPAFGELAEARGEEEQPAARFENARAADPAAAPLIEIERGVSRLIAAGDRAGAIRLYREFAAARPDDTASQLGFSDFLVREGAGDALALKLARETLQSVLTKNPSEPEIIRRLVPLDRANGRMLIDQLLSDEPRSASLFASLSQSLQEGADEVLLAEIDRRYQLAFEAHPEDVAFAREVSEHFHKTKRPDRAIDVLKRHTEAAPWSLDLRVQIGVLYLTAKRDAEGEAALKEVLAIHPKHALAHQALAKFYRQQENSELAVYHAGELLKIRGGSASEFLKLADEHMAASRPREARLLLEKAAFFHPDHAEIYMKLAIATHQDPESRAMAPRLFREAESAAANGKISDPAFLTASAEALIESGQGKAAEERLRAAIRAYPADAKKETAAALRRLAALWENENRNADAARALLQRADSLDPK
jgi:Flp pilus assembly protein TadD